MIQFSVIIPLYNKANFVKKTIESVLAQTYNEFEVIVVNDGSTDNSLEVVGKMNDSRIRVFTKENGGVSAARNFGMEKAQYEYIAFLDADDLWMPDYLETIHAMIKQYPRASVYSTGRTDVSLDEKFDRIIPSLPKGEVSVFENYVESLVKGEMIHLWTGTVCAKKDLCIEVGGFRLGVKRGEDLDMWLRLSLKSPIVWKNESKALYNQETENNVMASYNSYKESFPYWEWCYSNSLYVKKYARSQTMGLMKKAYRNKKWNDVVNLLFKLLKITM